MNIAICGGGSLGHVVCGVLGTRTDCSVRLLTSHPNDWEQNIKVIDKNDFIYQGHIDHISLSPEEIIPTCDIVLLCLPGFLIEEELQKISPYIGSDTFVGTIVSSTGFFLAAKRKLPLGTKLFGFQRVPYISRVKEYGRSAHLLGYKSSLNVAIENSRDEEEKELFAAQLEHLFATPVHLLNNFWEASLTNSNPLLHTCRLYSLWKDWEQGTIYKYQHLFYEDWDAESSAILLACDEEFQALLTCLPVDRDAIPSLLTYYGCSDAESLTNKMRDIDAFKGIKTPMKAVRGGYEPNFDNRYFTEDFPYGLKLIVEIARQHKLKTPTMEKVLAWGMSMLNLNFDSKRSSNE